MSEKSEYFVALLKRYAKEENNMVRDTMDTSPLEQWLGIECFKLQLKVQQLEQQLIELQEQLELERNFESMH